MQTFPTPEILADWLQAHAIETAAWGRGNAKSVTDLWREVQQAESALYTEPPLRRVRVVEVIVRQGTLMLLEAAQHLATGQVRRRDQPPSEKMHPHETPLMAAQRCLAEELGITDSATVRFAEQQVTTRTTEQESISYPGLVTEFTFYRLEAWVTGLPSGEFTTPNAAYSHGDPVIFHRWRWVDAN
ncbi:MAG: NUDIX domain-containing protein [Caldilineaceae bacterium]